MLTSNLLFYFFSILLVVSSIFVVISKHLIFSLLFLVSSFMCSTFLLFLIECEFLALLFIIIYVGALIILFLFAIMMLEFKLENIVKSPIKNLSKKWYMLFTFLLIIFFLLAQTKWIFKENLYSNTFYVNQYQNWYDLIDSTTDIYVYGQILYSYFVLQFLIIGLILLVVLIGVVYLINNYNSKQNLEQSIFKQLSRTSKIFFS